MQLSHTNPELVIAKARANSTKVIRDNILIPFLFTRGEKELIVGIEIVLIRDINMSVHQRQALKSHASPVMSIKLISVFEALTL